MSTSRSGRVPAAVLGLAAAPALLCRPATGPRQNAARPDFAEALAHAAGSDFKPASPYIAWLLPPSNGAETFMTLAAEDVMGRGEAKVPVADLLRDKIVLIGGNFDDRDQHLTPLSVTRDDFFTGLFIHAQILAQILRGRSVRELSVEVSTYRPIILVRQTGRSIERQQRVPDLMLRATTFGNRPVSRSSIGLGFMSLSDSHSWDGDPIQTEVIMKHLRVEQFPEGHLWNFAITHSDDGRVYLSPGDVRPNDSVPDEAETARHHLVGAAAERAGSNQA